MNQAREGGWGSERQRRREKTYPDIKQRHEHHMRPQCLGTARSVAQCSAGAEGCTLRTTSPQ